ncbi:hypothetical protein BT93_L4255 [Corymbia citriodora subsp. variegata]|uniref:LNS2/PITP domain-containing protein n=1 Tax=Corymbia citriodora subsp. variegata TaxID=360336 RepID=A0A8T0CG11_CORYI|nr:hypothetical protein BT93_L4255 [Corymbia citriodora subsp. variegata]
MKLGDGGEAFFVFKTEADIPASMQTSPLVSPISSPPTQSTTNTLSEPSLLDLTTVSLESMANGTVPRSMLRRENSDSDPQPVYGSSAPGDNDLIPHAFLQRSTSEELMSAAAKRDIDKLDAQIRRGSYIPPDFQLDGTSTDKPPAAPPVLDQQQALQRAMTLHKKLSTSNIKSKITDSGDLMLDMTGYKSSEDEALRTEALARRLLAEEIEGHYDIGALIGTDELGNLWIYSSEEARDAANRRIVSQSQPIGSDTTSDPGYHSDSDRSSNATKTHNRAKSEAVPASRPSLDASHFAKTLRLTSHQLKKLQLKSGPNPISFTVNKSTCTANMYLWRHDTPIVISDIDGTITKSDALGHVMTAIGKDWTHPSVAKLFSDIVANGYNIFYLTSRSVGQADTTRNYLNGVMQEGYTLPKGPVIMSPDRTYAALRREVYLRKPEVFKMACLRDILALFPGRTNPFYAGFGNRLTDALSYRTVNIPSSRIFTINSTGEVLLDLSSMRTYKRTYLGIREVVDHSFPPVNMLSKGGNEEYNDFRYWRNNIDAELDDFVPSDSEEDEYYDDDHLADSYISGGETLSRLDTAITRESIDIDDGVNMHRLRLTDSRRSNSATILSADAEDDTSEFVNDYVQKQRRAIPRREKTAPP